MTREKYTGVDFQEEGMKPASSLSGWEDFHGFICHDACANVEVTESVVHRGLCSQQQ